MSALGSKAGNATPVPPAGRAHRQGFEAVLRARLAAIGYEAGLADGRSAEGFFRVRTD